MHWLKQYVQTTHTGMQSSYEDWRGMCRPQYVVSILYDLLQSFPWGRSRGELTSRQDSQWNAAVLPLLFQYLLIRTGEETAAVSAARWEQCMRIRVGSWRRQHDFSHLQCQQLLLRSVHWVVSMVQTENCCSPKAQGKWTTCARSCGGLPQATRKKYQQKLHTKLETEGVILDFWNLLRKSYILVMWAKGGNFGM